MKRSFPSVPRAVSKLLVGFLLSPTIPAIADGPTLITGAGATFPAPLFSKWMAEYRKVDPSVQINYQSIGSGGGIRQFLAGTTDFGATDDPMTDAEVQQARDGVIHVPVTLGAVVLSYNLPGVSSSLKLSPDVVVDLFMGKISKWNDARIKALNPGVKFPDVAVIPCHRADGSGTTAVFTAYLAAVSRDWLNGVGKGKSVKFPIGLAGKGNEGVMGLLRQNPGAIGYVEMTYARLNKLPMASLKNPSGEFVEPSLDSVSKSAANLLSASDDLRLSVLNSPAKGAYPLSSFSFMLLRKKSMEGKGLKLKEFMRWALTDGQGLAPGLDYAKLPSAVVTKAQRSVEIMQ